ncbi:MAG: hypothetical protein Q4C94_03890, partial [Neisseria sp.]|nr:hypothetical protein [Neisseria sp.]
MKTATLNNGITMPMLGFGVYQIAPEQTESAFLPWKRLVISPTCMGSHMKPVNVIVGAGAIAQVIARRIQRNAPKDLITRLFSRKGNAMKPTRLTALAAAALFALAACNDNAQSSGDAVGTASHTPAPAKETGSAAALPAQLIERANRGEAAAQTELSYYYGRAKSFDQAFVWFEKAAAQGYSEAQYNLGVLYSHHGYGVAQDYAQARQWFEKAAAQGYS